MTNVEKLKVWIEKEKEKGLVAFSVTPKLDVAKGMSVEDFVGDMLHAIEGLSECARMPFDEEECAGEILEMNAAIERGDYKEVNTFGPKRDGESCGPNCDCYPQK